MKLVDNLGLKEVAEGDIPCVKLKRRGHTFKRRALSGIYRNGGLLGAYCSYCQALPQVQIVGFFFFQEVTLTCRALSVFPRVGQSKSLTSQCRAEVRKEQE